MSENLRIWTEIGFNIFYLVFIWILVIRMFRRNVYNPGNDGGVGGLFRLGFLMLAIGDTGHVGFRVWAYALGGLESSVNIFGWNMPLVGAGALSTAVLVTILYMLMVEAERRWFNQKWNFIYVFLLSMGFIRFGLMCFPGNHWENTVPPADWSLYRNIPLTILGLGLAILMLLHSGRMKDGFFRYLAILILISYAFYLPVILWVQTVPALGMLMIPKTIAYLLMAVAVYRKFFRSVRAE